MAMNNMADKEHADKACPLCGGRVMWFPVSRHWCCEHCRNTFNGFTVFPEPKTREPNGNAAKLREALMVVRDAIYRDLTTGRLLIATDVNLEDVVSEALAVPPRNCDVGTAEEQMKRQHDTMCNTTKACPDSDWSCKKCFAEWAQLPYESEEAK